MRTACRVRPSGHQVIRSSVASDHQVIRSSGHQVISRPGFTLVEVLVAAVVLAIGVSAGVRALGAMEQASAAAADRQTAVRLAGERLALIEGVEGVSAGRTEGQFDSAPRFRWQQQISAAPAVSGVLEVTVTITWPEEAMTRHYAVSTYLLDPSQQAANQTAAGGGG